MSSTFLLEWRFSPPDYFEESGKTTIDNYELHFEEGYIKVEVHESEYEKVKSIRDELHKAINDRFLGAQLISHQPYELTKASITGIKPDGGRLLFGEVHFQGKLDVKKIDFQLRKEDGTIIDTRKERIERKSRLAELVAKYGNNQTVNKIINSFHNAIINPDKQLVYLFEIWETLKKELGGEKKALELLGITHNELKKLSALANNPEIRQGRHSGKEIFVRDATKTELDDAKDVAGKLIEGFLEYLENQPP